MVFSCYFFLVSFNLEEFSSLYLSSNLSNLSNLSSLSFLIMAFFFFEFKPVLQNVLQFTLFCSFIMRVKFTFCLHFSQEYYMSDGLSPEHDIAKHQMLVCFIIGHVMFDHLVYLLLLDLL